MSYGQCLSVRVDGHPLPSVRCLPKDNVDILVSSDGSKYNLCVNKENTKITCTVSDAFGGCNFTLEVHKQSKLVF